jgi:hypothetical protein
MESVKIFSNFINEEDIKVYRDYIDKYKDTDSFRMNPSKLNGLGSAYRAVFPEEKKVEQHKEILPITKKYSDMFIQKCKESFGDDRDLYFYGTSITRLSSEVQLRIHKDIHDSGDHISYSGVMYLNDDYEGGSILFLEEYPEYEQHVYTYYDESMSDAFIYNQKAGDLVIFHPHQLHGSTKVESGWRDAIVLWCTSNKESECKI